MEFALKKTGIILLIFLVILSFNNCTEKNKKKTKIKTEENVLDENFDWLLGSWKRNNEEEDKETFEIWVKNNNSEYSGIGFTLQDTDTIHQEEIKLKKIGKKWVLEVRLRNEPEPITFNMTSNNEYEFICENKKNDFPNLIKYWKNGNNINALVSSDDMEISFEFERVVEK